MTRRRTRGFSIVLCSLLLAGMHRGFVATLQYGDASRDEWALGVGYAE